MSTRLIGIVIGLLVTAFYAAQLYQATRPGGTAVPARRRPMSRSIAVIGIVIGLGVTAWWILS